MSERVPNQERTGFAHVDGRTGHHMPNAALHFYQGPFGRSPTKNQQRLPQTEVPIKKQSKVTPQKRTRPQATAGAPTQKQATTFPYNLGNRTPSARSNVSSNRGTPLRRSAYLNDVKPAGVGSALKERAAPHLVDHVRDEVIRPKETKTVFETTSSAHKRDGFVQKDTKNPIIHKKDITGKIEAHADSSYRPSPRFPYGVIHPKPRPMTTTLRTENVGENIEGSVLKRDLANNGQHLINYEFKHHVITNERKGAGVFQVRTRNDLQTKQYQQDLSSRGLQTKVAKNFIANRRD